MRVLHATSSYPLNPEDSTAPFMQEMLIALVEQGMDVTAVVPRMRGLVEGDRSGVTVVGAPYAPRRLQVWGYSKSLDARNRIRAAAIAVGPLAVMSMGVTLRRQIAKNRPDVVHLHWALPQGLLMGAVPKDIPVVVSAHGADARFARGRLRPIAKRILRRADGVVAASSQILDLLAEIEPSIRAKSKVIPHGADSKLFAPMQKNEARTALGLDQLTPLVLAVGRLVSKKGFAQLIHCVGMLADTDIQLYIVGEGPERRLLEETTDDRVRGRVHLVGAQHRSLVAKWMAAADVVVVPGAADRNDVDSGPVVLMEALAMGRPIVATRIGMAPDVIEDDVNGYLIKSGDIPTMASTLEMALAESDRLGKGARRSFEAIGDWSRVAADLDSLYRRVIHKPKPGTH